ncbi:MULTISPECIES: amino acid adenylation domain-containing protein [Streptomyces]|uniref:Amino acid adenylation domain-containing protein n=1 Tax=Streptomyces eurythermus TaxID=42237 RepID=A0ABW6ZBC1_9ACTN|nr:MULTISPECIES: amino acid adenylation domain-containing protein [Streptomyces]QIS68696.1 amino acid adenylation domain-containing protein [Streptomyces sp. DSM 40868]
MTQAPVLDLPSAPGLPFAPGDRHAPLRRRECAAPVAWPGVPSHSVAVAAFAEVLHAWSRSPRFSVRLPGGTALVFSDQGDFAERLASVHAQLELGKRPAAGGDLPVAVAFEPGLVPDGVDLELRLVRDRCEWHFRDTAFPAGLVDDMFEAFGWLLAELRDPEDAATRTRFDLLPQWQLDRRVQVNDTAAPAPGGLLHTAVAEHARLRPDAPAVITAHRQLSYREFTSRVNQVGRKLRELGVRPNQLVAVAMEKGWEQIVAVHGVLAAGAAYLPVDVTLPTERMHVVLERGEVTHVLTQAVVDERLNWPEQVNRLRVDTDFDGLDDRVLEPVAAPTDLAYVIFTSGSTGVPKGVMVDHRGALNTIADINRRFGIGPEDRVIAMSGLQFDLSVFDSFGLLSVGGAVVVPDPSPKPDPAHWAGLVSDHGVTFWHSVPALLEMLVLYTEVTRRPDRLQSLRLALIGGDWIPVTLPDRLRALIGDVQVVSGGGPAEACVWSTLYPIGEVDPSWPSIPYGTALTNQQVHVLDEELRPCPVWVPGEMYLVSDIGLAQGYWRDAERTARQFVVLPSGRRAYATGDLGRFLPDGNVELVGRKDFQVKIQGVRIELGDIESAITAHPAVHTAVLVAARTGQDIPVLRAYLVARDGGVDVGQLREFLEAKLPKYMVPAGFAVLDALPLTGNGKVDRRALMDAG